MFPQSRSHLPDECIYLFGVNDYRHNVESLRRGRGGLMRARRLAGEDAGDVAVAQQPAESGGLAPAFGCDVRIGLSPVAKEKVTMA